MKEIRFEWAGLNCLAMGEFDDGEFITDSISVTGELEINKLSGKEWDNICAIMDKECDNLKKGI